MQKEYWLMLCLISLVGISGIYAENIHYINSLPYTIGEDGYYILNTSWTDAYTAPITINASNVVLDGNGNVMAGDGYTDKGIEHEGDTLNLTIKNIIIKNFTNYSVDIGGRNGTVKLLNVTLVNNGIRIKGSALPGEEQYINLTLNNVNILNASQKQSVYLYPVSVFASNTHLRNVNETWLRGDNCVIVNSSYSNMTFLDLLCNHITSNSTYYINIDRMGLLSPRPNSSITNCKFVNVSNLDFRVGKGYPSYNYFHIHNCTFANCNIMHKLSTLNNTNYTMVKCNFINSSLNITETVSYYRPGFRTRPPVNLTAENVNVSIYLCNFINSNISYIAIKNINHKVTVVDNENAQFYSPTPINYTYNGKTHTNYLGNYYSDYNGTDSNGDGIGDIPYVIDSNNNDSYPLIAPVENYIINGAEEENNTNTTIPTNAKYINTLPYTIDEDGYYILNTSCNNIDKTAITIDADHVVLDGNGKVLDGDPWSLDIYHGVYVPHHNNVTIKNLTIKEFMFGGITIESSSDVTITNVTINHSEITLDSSSYSTITNFYIDGGISISKPYKPNTIAPSHNIIANGTIINGEISLDTTSHNIITNVTLIQGNLPENVPIGDTYGIDIEMCNNTIIYLNNIINYTYGINEHKCNNTIIYLNNFINNDKSDIMIYFSHNNTFHSPTQLNYTYNGKTFVNYLGNYHSDYNGTDSDGDGIGDIPYTIYGEINDTYPLMKPYENYISNGEITITEEKKPDLTIESFEVPTNAVVNNTHILTATIKNIGNSNATTFNVSLMVNEQVMGKKIVNSLNVNKNKTVSFNWTPMAEGTYDLKVVVDSENAIDELNESNNAKMMTITVSAPTPSTNATKIIHLHKGWNAISLPHKNTISFKDTNVPGLIITYYNNSWKINTKNTLKVLYGYFIYCKNDTVMYVKFINSSENKDSLVPPSRIVYKGYNLVGVNPSKNDYENYNGQVKLSDYLVSIQPHWVQMLSLDGYVWNKYNNASNIYLQPYKAYWLFVDKTCELAGRNTH